MGVKAVQIRPSSRTPWADEIRFSNRDAFFANGFLELGVDTEKVHRLVQQYHQANEAVQRIYSLRAPRNFSGRDGIGTWFEIRRDQVKRVWDSAIEDIFRDHQFLIEDSTRTRVEVPLFHLNSAPVKHSRTVYEEIVTAQTEQSWVVTVLGSGMGATQSFKVTYATKLKSTDGHSKLVFVPITLIVYLIGCYEHGKRIRTALRTEMAEIGAERWLPGVRSRPQSAVLPTLRESDVFREHFPLSGDTSASIQSYHRSVKAGVEFEFGAGVEAFDLAVKSKIKIKQERELKLTFDLPAGHDYEASSVHGLSGVWWRVL